MANERLADLTPAEAYEIASQDPRAKLMERLYSTPESKGDLEKLVRKHGKLFPNAQLPPDIEGIAAETAKATVKDDLQAIADLRKELAEERKAQKLTAFHAAMVEAGAQPEDVEKIDQFMLDNDFGPKAVTTAVTAYYEATPPAEPTNTGGPWGPWQPQDGDAKMMETLAQAGPNADLYQLGMPHIEQVFKDMTKGRQSKVLAR